MGWRVQTLVLVVVLAVGAQGVVRAGLAPDLTGFRDHVAPILSQYCVGCHGPEKQKGKMRLDRIDPDLLTGEDFGKWEDVREVFNTGDMPPKDKPKPTDAEREGMARWMDAEFKKAKLHGSTKKRGNVRRLTRYELQYALEDLLGFPVNQDVSGLPEEGTSLKTGLKNSSRLLMISGPHLEAYLDSILSVITRMKVIAAFEPYVIRADIQNLDVNPPVTYAYEQRKNKPPVAKVQRAGKGIVIDVGGYVDLKIPSVPGWKFETALSAKAGVAGRLEVTIGFQHSEFDPRQVTTKLGDFSIGQSETLQAYTLTSYPGTLSDEFTRGDRPFFIRITNRTAKNLYLETFEHRGNVNTDLTAKLIPPELVAPAEVELHAGRSIQAFITQAFRRPASPAELNKYHGIYGKHAKEASPVLALLSVYKEILCSPKFFYLGLPGRLPEQANANFQMAENLALFLWCSVPDRQLLDAAADRTLRKPSVLKAEVERMLKDEKSRRWVEHFADQWLHTSQLFNVAVDRKYYPRFKDSLKTLMHQETYEALNDVFRNGASAMDLLQAEHVFVNQPLAAFYRINGVKGDAFRKVPVDAKSNRGGLLTQGTFLVGNSDGMNSHAILRGVWLSEVILDDPPPDPPANVPPLDESIPGFNKMTLNEKLFAHRDNEGCRSCHRKIDPWGIPFENFDASGVWRDKALVISKTDGPKKKKPVFEKIYLPVENQSILPDGMKIEGIGKLKEYLVSDRRRDFSKGLVERILAYALSRDVDFHDEEHVNQLVDLFERNQHSVPSLIQHIVQSEIFLKGDHTDGI